jgi:CheY-like chemotaxis protein/HPt (histidine-containing phosphotransfer) domain-containing protein
VLTDVHMPDVDGFELTERIRTEPDLGGAVILMLTSGDGPGDIDRCRKVGAAAHLMKPIKQSELFDAIIGSVGIVQEGERQSRDGLEEPGEMRPLRILLAEDSYPNQRLAVGLLSKWGHRIMIANNGREALAALERDSFDVVLMDVQMPEMDGYQATAVIREREAGTKDHIPIIAMTAHAMKGDREECLAAGMDGYVAKPIRRRELQKVLQEILVQKPIEGSLDRPAETVAAPILGPPNWAHALETAEGDPELLDHVLRALLDECPALLGQIEQALRGGDASALKRAAHTLKGGLQMFGQTRARELVERLEELGQDDLRDESRQMFALLAAETNALLDEVRRHASEQTP